MKTNAIQLNTNYFMPDTGSKLTSFRGDSKTTPSLPAQGQDVVQLQDKTTANENSTNNQSGSKIHSMYKNLKHFFMDEPSFDPGFDDLDAVIYRSLTY